MKLNGMSQMSSLRTAVTLKMWRFFSFYIFWHSLFFKDNVPFKPLGFTELRFSAFLFQYAAWLIDYLCILFDWSDKIRIFTQLSLPRGSCVFPFSSPFSTNSKSDSRFGLLCKKCSNVLLGQSAFLHTLLAQSYEWRLSNHRDGTPRFDKQRLRVPSSSHPASHLFNPQAFCVDTQDSLVSVKSYRSESHMQSVSVSGMNYTAWDVLLYACWAPMFHVLHASLK